MNFLGNTNRGGISAHEVEHRTTTTLRRFGRIAVVVVLVAVLTVSGILTAFFLRPDPPMLVMQIGFSRGGEIVSTLTAEVAITPNQISTGLMFREDLPEGYGMLFVFGECSRLSFWMKNTSIPLSIAFICAEAIITEFRDMTPFDLTPIVSTYPSRFALEVPQGWFKRAGVQIGDVVVVFD